jgi:nicotinate-nucleotide pyrophosphorylase (carboxylating)
VIALVKGNARAILSAERTALNFLQRLSGIATLTNKYVSKVKGTKARILDTRKTGPGLRREEKAAVRAGGGSNHRFGLFDAVLIKDNHIAAVRDIKKMIGLANRKGRVEIETKTLSQVKKAIDAGADMILLDNMSTKNMKKAVAMIRSRSRTVKIEASGGITLKNIRSAAKTGVDFISVGAITHSPRALDISLEIMV